MGVLRSVVAPSTALVSFCDSKIIDCGSIRFEIIRDELVWHKTVFLQKLAHQSQRRLLVPSGLDQDVEHFALGVNGAPQIDHAAIDLQIDLVQMPGRMGLRPPFAQVRRDPRPEMVHPAPDRLIGNNNPAFGQQILDVAEAQRKPEIDPDRVLDDFGRKAIAAITDFGHLKW